MKFKKVCMNCANEFEADKLFDNILVCPKCLSGDIYQPIELDYDNATLEDCFIEYFTNKVASVFNADSKEIYFMEE